MRGKASVLHLFQVFLVACSGSQAAEAPAAPPPMPVQIDTVRAVKLRDASEYVATVRSLRSVQVQPQVAGYLTQILAAPGDVVRPGAVLMQIDPSRQQAVVRSQQATRTANEAQLEYARAQYQRAQRLYAGGAGTKMSLDQALASLKQADATVASSEAQVNAQAVDLDYHRVTASAPGTVGDIPVRIGDYVTPQTVVTTLDDNSALEMYLDVPLERASALRLQLPVELLDSQGKVLATTTLSFISPRANPDTQTIMVKSQLQSSTAGLRAGQFTRARVIWSEHEGPAVPVLAVQNRNGQAFAWAVKPEEHAAPGQQPALQAQPRVVEVGPIQGQLYPVLRGLAVGESIVVSGVQKLRPGARVSALQKQTPPQAGL